MVYTYRYTYMCILICVYIYMYTYILLIYIIISSSIAFLCRYSLCFIFIYPGCLIFQDLNLFMRAKSRHEELQYLLFGYIGSNSLPQILHFFIFCASSFLLLPSFANRNFFGFRPFLKTYNHSFARNAFWLLLQFHFGCFLNFSKYPPY